MKGGIGSAAITLPDGLTVAALVAVNAYGDVIDPATGRVVAGVRTEDGRALADARVLLRTGAAQKKPVGENSTIGVVATNARLTKTQATKVAQMAHDGLARSITPVHTLADGDTLFALATGTLAGDADVSQIGALAAEAVADAVLRAVRAAKGLPGCPPSATSRRRHADVNLHLLLLVGYSAGLLLLGLAVSRRVQSASSFFVANRQLSAALIFSTVLAANIGAGSTVGATGLGYRDGLSAWWWNGSAAIGSLLLAFWIGPRVWRQASAHGFLTTGDLLEHHFGRTVRALVTAMLWLATLSILAGQLVGVAWILNVVAGLPKWAGCLIGGGLMTAYFAAGGLLGSAWVNLVQLVVLLCGFAIVLPAALAHAGGLSAVIRSAPHEGFSGFWNGATSVSFLVLLVPGVHLVPGPAAEGVRRGERAGRPARHRLERRGAVRVRLRARGARDWRRASTTRACRRNWRCPRCSRATCRWVSAPSCSRRSSPPR